MKMTKDELIAENANLQNEAVDWRNADRTRRQEFAKAFNWYKQDRYSTTRDPMEPTWPEIYVELGRILAARTFMDLSGNVSELEMGLKSLTDFVHNAGKDRPAEGRY